MASFPCSEDLFSALFEANGKTPTSFQWELIQTLTAHICAQSVVGYGEMQSVQSTVTNGITPRTSDAVGNQGEVKLFITLHQINFLIHGNPTAKEMLPY